MSAEPPAIPTEIRDVILDELRGDKTTLKACSLVNKSWRGRSQYLLFRTKTLTLSGRESWKAACIFLRAVASHSPRFSLTEELHIRGTSADACINHHSLYHIVKHMPKLRVLSLVYLNLLTNLTLGGPVTKFFDALPRLTELRVLRFCEVHCHLSSPDNGYRHSATSKFDVVRQDLDIQGNSFACLEELHLDGNNFPPSRVCRLLDAAVSTHSRILKMDSKPRGFRGLRRATLPLSPWDTKYHDENIYFDIIRASGGQLLEVAALTLEHMTLDFGCFKCTSDITGRDMRGYIEFCKQLNISSCQKLRSLTFVLPAHYGVPDYDDGWLTAAACLHLVSSTAPLESLTILTQGPGVMFRFIDLDDQKELLQYFDTAACTLNHLKRVKITPCNRVWDFGSTEFLAVVKEQLPKLQKKVKLTVRE